MGDMMQNDNASPATTGTYGNDKVVVIARQVVRFILSHTENQKTIITKSRLQNVIKELTKRENVDRLQFRQIYPAINGILGDVYGFELRGLPPRVATGTTMQNGQRSVTSGSVSLSAVQEHDGAQDFGYQAEHFIVINSLPRMAHFDQFKFTQDTNIYEQRVVNEEYIGDDVGFASTNTIDSKSSLDQDLVMKGILSVILCIILFSKNNILQRELFTYLEQYGVPTDGTKIPIANMTIDELLRTIEKREYIIKLEEKSDIGDETIVYRIGRRTQAEFSIENLTEMLQELMGLDPAQGTALQEDIKRSIGDSYGPVAR